MARTMMQWERRLGRGNGEEGTLEKRSSVRRKRESLEAAPLSLGGRERDPCASEAELSGGFAGGPRMEFARDVGRQCSPLGGVGVCGRGSASLLGWCRRNRFHMLQ